MSHIYVPADRGRHRAWIETAQVETAAISYGRPAAEAEVSSLAHRLDLGFDTQDTRVVVLQAAGTPAGYFWIEARSDRQWFLLDIWIAPAHRGRGLGNKLLREALRQAAALDSRELRLAVAARNEVARRLFEAEGFVVNDTMLRDGRTWLEMRKMLPAASGNVEKRFPDGIG